jgi:hypothetical protein
VLKHRGEALLPMRSDILDKNAQHNSDRSTLPTELKKQDLLRRKQAPD